eukprot:scaffold554_cov271-Prasinococcus_capsulatus_cf.AAC.3
MTTPRRWPHNRSATCCRSPSAWSGSSATTTSCSRSSLLRTPSTTTTPSSPYCSCLCPVTLQGPGARPSPHGRHRQHVILLLPLFGATSARRGDAGIICATGPTSDGEVGPHKPPPILDAEPRKGCVTLPSPAPANVGGTRRSLIYKQPARENRRGALLAAAPSGCL